jgi:hypothetical protein
MTGNPEVIPEVGFEEISAKSAGQSRFREETEVRAESIAGSCRPGRLL